MTFGDPVAHLEYIIQRFSAAIRQRREMSPQVSSSTFEVSRVATCASDRRVRAIFHKCSIRLCYCARIRITCTYENNSSILSCSVRSVLGATGHARNKLE